MRGPADGRLLAADPAVWVAAGTARIPEDRRDVGAIGALPVWENAISERYRKPFASARTVAPPKTSATAT